jgi:hypothetical protein
VSSKALHAMLQGGISIVAHSLGSVLTWDILSCQPRLYATLPVHHITPSGAADDSVAALERLGRSSGRRGAAPSSNDAAGGHASLNNIQLVWLTSAGAQHQAAASCLV